MGENPDNKYRQQRDLEEKVGRDPLMEGNLGDAEQQAKGMAERVVDQAKDLGGKVTEKASELG